MAFSAWTRIGDGVPFKSQNGKVDFRMIIQARYEIYDIIYAKVQLRAVILTTQTSASYYGSKANLNASINNTSVFSGTSSKPSSSSGWDASFAQTVAGTKYVKGFCPGSGTWEVKITLGAKAVSVPLKVSYQMTYTNNWAPVKSTYTANATLVIPAVYTPATIKPEAQSYNFGETAKFLITPGDTGTYSYDVRYSWNKYTDSIANKTTSKNITWNIPLNLMNNIPNDLSMKNFIVYVDTYSGNTLVGTNQCSITLNVPNGIGPEITSIDISEAVTNIASLNLGLYLSNASRLNIKVNANTDNAYKSSIKSYSISGINNITYSNDTVTTDILKDSGDITITVKVSDSRGRTATATKLIVVKPYQAPAILENECRRCDINGNLDDNGEYVKIIFKGIITSVKDSSDVEKNNPKDFRIQYKNSDLEYFQDEDVIILNDYIYQDDDGNYRINIVNIVENKEEGVLYTEDTFDSDEEYDFVYLASDYISEEPIGQEETLYSGFGLMDFHSSGRSISFGKVCDVADDADIVEMGLNFDVQKGFTKNGKDLYLIEDEDGNLRINGETFVGETGKSLNSLAGLSSSLSALINTVNEHTTSISNANTNITNLTNKAINAITSSANGCIKWNNGIMIQWSTYTVTKAGGTQWGSSGMYYSDHQPGNWATAFKTLFNVQVSSHTLQNWAVGTGATATSKGTIRFFRPNSNTGEATAYLLAIGTWK